MRADAVAVECVRRSHKCLHSRFIMEGRLVMYPSKKLHRYHELLHLVGLLNSRAVYREREVNEIFRNVWDDFAYLRRELVDHGYLRRNSRGEYWLVDGSECFEILHADAPL